TWTDSDAPREHGGRSRYRNHCLKATCQARRPALSYRAMRILGLSNMRDAAAALVDNGRIIAAAEEERFVRVKHVTALPLHAIRFCLEAGGTRLEDLDAV